MIKKSVKAIIKDKNFVEYCSFYSVDSNEVVNDDSLMNHIQENQTSLEQLIAGYMEMGALNQEICGEFWNCECSSDHEDELKEYNNFLKESEKLLKKNKLEPKKINLMAKISSKMGIAMETMKDNSDPAIASMVIEGLTMGIVEMETKIENYKKIVDKKILKLSNKFVKFQEEEIEKLKTFM